MSRSRKWNEPPTDSLRVTELVDDPYVEWTQEGAEVLVDAGPTVPIRYVFDQKDVTAYDPTLESALAARMAAEIAEDMNADEKRGEKALIVYDRIISRAKKTNAREKSPSPTAESTWLTARN